MFPTCGLGAGTHGDVFNVHTGTFWTCTRVFFHVFFTVPQHTKHTPRPPTTPRPQRHHHHHNDTHHITQHGDRNRERQRKRDKRRQEKTRQDNKAREEKRRDEKEERTEKRREKREDERENEQRQTIFSWMSAGAGIIFTPNSGECLAAPELFSPNVRDVRRRRN